MKWTKFKEVVDYIKSYEYILVKFYDEYMFVKSYDLFFVKKWVNDFPRAYEVQKYNDSFELKNSDRGANINLMYVNFIDPFTSDYKSFREWHYNFKSLYLKFIIIFGVISFCLNQISDFWFMYLIHDIFIVLIIGFNLYLWYLKKCKKKYVYNEKVGD